MADKIYIKVPEEKPYPEMPWYVRALAMFIPSANPDFAALYPKVNVWLLEVSVPDGLPRREIGLDEQMEPIVAGPIGRNYGTWVDGPENLDITDYEVTDAALFSSAWQKIENKLYGKYRDSGYRTKEKWVKECRRVCALSDRILAGEGDFLDNARKMNTLGFWMWESENEDFAVFSELVKVSAHLPVGDARRHWDEGALAAKDKEIREIEKRYKPRVLKAAVSIKEKYAQLLGVNKREAAKHEIAPALKKRLARLFFDKNKLLGAGIAAYVLIVALGLLLVYIHTALRLPDRYIWPEVLLVYGPLYYFARKYFRK